MDIQKKNTIYYGTSIEFIEEIDKIGMIGPRHRNEQYISVTISGYESKYDLSHDDLIEFGRVYSEVLDIADIVDNRLIYKLGYENSMTYIEGFGPNPSKHLRTFYGLVENKRTFNTLTVVLRPEAIDRLVIPDTDRKFEFLSLGLHCFINEIREEDIIAWIVPEIHYERICNMVIDGTLKNREVICDTTLKSHQFNYGMISKYGSYPSNIKFYCKGLAKSKQHRDVRINHLKFILQDFDEINWHLTDNELENEIIDWMHNNQDKIRWNNDSFKYIKRD